MGNQQNAFTNVSLGVILQRFDATIVKLAKALTFGNYVIGSLVSEGIEDVRTTLPHFRSGQSLHYAKISFAKAWIPREIEFLGLAH